MSTIAVVGLGNPGEQYIGTRHNAGFWMLDNLVSRNDGSWKHRRRFHSMTSLINSWPRPTLLVKPMTCVNDSGAYLKPLIKYHDCLAKEVIVVHDDTAFPIGQIKISEEKGDGGHNGIKNIMRAIGPNFIRFRLGIGKKPVNKSMSSYVLGKFSALEQIVIKDKFDFFSEVLQRIVDKGAAHAMNLSNKRKNPTHDQPEEKLHGDIGA